MPIALSAVQMDVTPAALRPQADGEGFCLGQVDLPVERTAPSTKQPPSLLPPYANLVSDSLAWMSMGGYFQNRRRKPGA